jgi:uncharacterized SAM-dependent methyltransferase
MPAQATITVHQTQWPRLLARQLGNSLRERQINPKFHYDSHRQVLRWLRLHEAYSPSRRAQEFRDTYEPAFATALQVVGSDAVHVVGLGCGGAQKEAALLERLGDGSRPLEFTATDVSSGMVVTALQAAWPHLDPSRCSGLVCDLVEAQDLNLFLDAQTPPRGRRIVTFFGIIPNFEPETVQRLLGRVLRPGDLLLYSANLAPTGNARDAGEDYRAGVDAVLAQYDNALTRQWLFTLLQDLGVEAADGEMAFQVEEAPVGRGFLRITAKFHFLRPVVLVVETESFPFDAGEALRLFFSYRHTPGTLNQLFSPIAVEASGAWISGSGEEGVFLARAGG